MDIATACFIVLQIMYSAVIVFLAISFSLLAIAVGIGLILVELKVIK